jgi:hypothetical protein
LKLATKRNELKASRLKDKDFLAAKQPKMPRNFKTNPVGEAQADNL